MAFGANVTSWSQAKVQGRVDDKKIEIGDQIHFYLEAEIPQGAGRISWPSLPGLDGLEWVDTGRVDSFKDGKLFIYKQKLTLSGFDSGQFVIPQIAFDWTDAAGNVKTLSTDSFVIDVTTLAVDVNGGIKPNKEFIVEMHWWDYWPQIIGIVLGLALVFFVVKWILVYLKKRKNKPKHTETAEQKALRLLHALEHKNFEGDDGQKQFYSELTHIIKEFIDARYRISFSEMTTDEILQLTKKNNKIRNLRSALKQIFSTADLAKFAKAKPGETERDLCLQAAKIIIEQSRVEPMEGSNG